MKINVMREAEMPREIKLARTKIPCENHPESMHMPVK